MNSETDTQLDGYKLTLARTVWVVITTMALVIRIADIPPGYVQYLTVCTQTIMSKSARYSGHGKVAAVSRTCPSSSTPSTLRLFRDHVCADILVIGVVIAWRKSGDWMALLVSLTLIILGTAIRILITSNWQVFIPSHKCQVTCSIFFSLSCHSSSSFSSRTGALCPAGHAGWRFWFFYLQLEVAFSLLRL